MNQLKPCPFCGGRAVIFPVNMGGREPLWRAGCAADYCGATGMLVATDKEAAMRLTAEHWNKRETA